jgi:hypothetical protein
VDVEALGSQAATITAINRMTQRMEGLTRAGAN